MPLSGRRAGRSRRARPGRIRRGRRWRRVLELLLGTEQRVERLLAQTLAERDRQAGADDGHPQAAGALLRLLRRAERVGRFLQRCRRLTQLLLRLLVVQRGLWALAVRHASVSIPRGLVSGPQVLAQVVVLDQTLHVRVVLGGLAGGDRSGPDRCRLLLGCHLWIPSPSAGCPRTIPGAAVQVTPERCPEDEAFRPRSRHRPPRGPQ